MIMNLEYRKLRDKIFKEQVKYQQDKLFRYIQNPIDHIVINHKYLNSDKVLSYLESGYLTESKLMRRGITISLQNKDGHEYYRVRGLGSFIHLIPIDELDKILENVERNN